MLISSQAQAQQPVKVQRLTVETMKIEYNTDKSAEYLIYRDKDIVRYSLEMRRV